jgi:hypothetical protein
MTPADPGIDPEKHQLLTLAQVTRLPWLPRLRRGKRITFSAVYRWAVHGIGGVKLETISIGGTMYTTVPALKEFFCARGARPIRTLCPRRNSSLAEHYQHRPALRGAAMAELEAERIGL